MPEAYIVEAVRSPVGRKKGGLSKVHPADLGAHVIKGLVERTGIDPGVVDDVVFGCVDTVATQAGDVARTCWLAAGYPEHVPGVTVDRQCGSSQQAVHFAAQAVMSGINDVVVAGGGGAGGKGKASNQGEGADDFVFQLNQQEFLDFVFEDLELPNLVRKKLKDSDSYKFIKGGYLREGIPRGLRIRELVLDAVECAHAELDALLEGGDADVRLALQPLAARAASTNASARSAS